MTDLDDLRSAHTVAQATQDEANGAASRLHRLIADAIDEGVSTLDIAEALGISRPRVYQLRAKARRD